MSASLWFRNQAVLAALLIGWILLEQQAHRLRQELACQPTGHEAGPVSSWALCSLLVQSMRTIILGTWTWSQLRASLLREQEMLLYHRQKRPHQESFLLEYWSKLLCQGYPPCVFA